MAVDVLHVENCFYLFAFFAFARIVPTENKVIPTADYVVCASNTRITYFAQNKINFFLIHT